MSLSRSQAGIAALGVVLAVGGIVGYLGIQRWVRGTWSATDLTVELPPDVPAAEQMHALSLALPADGQRVLDHISWRGWEGRLKPGRYAFPAGEAVSQSAARLVTGNREAARVVVPSGRDVGPIAGACAKNIWADSAEIATLLMHDTVMWRVVPNTYEVWWETDASGLVDRLLREHDTWWTSDRVAAARAQGLTPREATVLASIVQAETAVLDEAPVVAGLYLNRLKKGMALQADPTLIFALGDPSIRRVLDVHKEVDSPYNTYLHTGLPPGPIRFVDPRYLQSVLNPASHNHLYMCAEPGGTGRHRFATSYREHLRNARAYQSWLNKQRIFR